MSERVIRPASYGILVREEAILLCRLSSQAQSVGYWTLPGGGIEFGEHPEEGLVREIFEETGLTASKWEFLQIQSEVELYQNKTYHVLRFFYRVSEFSGDLRVELDGTTDTCEWVPLNQVASLPTVRLVQHALTLL